MVKRYEITGRCEGCGQRSTFSVVWTPGDAPPDDITKRWPLLQCDTCGAPALSAPANGADLLEEAPE